MLETAVAGVLHAELAKIPAFAGKTGAIILSELAKELSPLRGYLQYSKLIHDLIGIPIGESSVVVDLRSSLLRMHFRPSLQGYLNRVHGGAIQTVLDSSMAALALCHSSLGSEIAVTGKSSFKFHAPVPINEDVKIFCAVEKHLNATDETPETLRLACRLTMLSGGRVCVEGDGLFCFQAAPSTGSAFAF